MLKSNRTILIFGVLVALLFVGGIVRLFALRFEAGDVFPPYSSYRSDPLGTRAIIESLAEIPSIQTQRHTLPLRELDGNTEQTIIFAAVAPRAIQRSSDIFPDVAKSVVPIPIEELERLASEGSRVVIALEPSSIAPRVAAGFTPDPHSDDAALDGSQLIIQPFLKWGIRIGSLPLRGDDDIAFHVSERDLPIPETPVTWQSTLFFKPAPSSSGWAEWNEVYLRRFDRGTVALIMERQLGQGSLIIVSDSYFLSNEAMRMDRHPELLTWIIGPSEIVIFDESHLNVTLERGVMTLVRSLNLHYALFGLLALGLLLIWKGTSRLVPVTAESDLIRTRVKGRDAAAAMTHLLRRAIPSAEVLDVCWRKWQESHPHLTTSRMERAKQAEAYLMSIKTGQSNLIRSYREIARLLSGKDQTRE